MRFDDELSGDPQRFLGNRFDRFDLAVEVPHSLFNNLGDLSSSLLCCRDLYRLSKEDVLIPDQTLLKLGELDVMDLSCLFTSEPKLSQIFVDSGSI